MIITPTARATSSRRRGVFDARPQAVPIATVSNICLCGCAESNLRRQVGRFSILRCTRCNLERLTPQPTASELDELYGQAYFESADPASPGYAAYGAMEDALRVAAETQLGTLLESAPSDRRLLDVGCGYGTFVAAAGRAGWNARGFDCSAAAAAAARVRYGVDIAVGDFASQGVSDENSYDVVTMWDAIEHFPDPLQALESAFRALKPGGRLILSTPDVKSWDARLLGPKWYGYTKVPEHLWYFSRDTLRELGELAGFRLVEARPWGFVRSVEFCTEKLGTYHPALGRAARWLTDGLGLSHRRLFFQILDMLVVFERPALDDRSAMKAA
jgi:SAM-dependent methyltransferase